MLVDPFILISMLTVEFPLPFYKLFNYAVI